MEEYPMPRGRPRKQEIVLNSQEREQLEGFAHSRSIAAGLARRAQIVLLSSSGHSSSAIAKRVGLSSNVVGHWRKRYLTLGLSGLYDELRSGRPRTYNDERIAKLVKTALQKRPKGQTHWSVRSMAQESSLSKSTVQRVFRLFGLQPHRQKTFTLSTDPLFVDKVRDIVGLYLNPPENALVLCVDEKSQIQALERSQPILPMGLGYVDGVTHTYYRHGTTTLFAALDIASGKVMTQCKQRHRHQEFLSFLNHVEAQVPKSLDVHLVLDNYATHKHPKIRLWLAQRPRYHVHFVPTYSSWLNQVEIWFRIITQKAIRRGSFSNVRELVQRIEHFVQHHNQNAAPFVWTATAQSILDKIQRLCKII